ncbi:hypothetical protein MKX03_005959, partial [Papaver bracteatum]
MNRIDYASWVMQVGGAKVIMGVAEGIGVGVHFKPYVTREVVMVKYGGFLMHNLIQDLLGWESFYLCGRLQKPVNILADSINIEKLNSNDLRVSTPTALLLLPSGFSE